MRTMFNRLSDFVSHKASVTEGVFDVLAEKDTKYWPILFYGILLAYVVRVVYESLGFSDKARLFPLIVGSLLLVMLTLKISLLLLPERYTPQITGIFDPITTEFEGAATTDVDKSTRYRKEFAMILWLVALFPIIWIFGFLKSLTLFVFLFVYVYERDFVRALFVTALSAVLVYALFVELLNAQLYRGIVRLPIVAGVLS